MSRQLLWLGVFGLGMLALEVKGQNQALNALKEAYATQEGQPCFAVLPAPEGVVQVLLIRHGEPDLYKKGWRKRTEAVQFALDYDSAGVKPISPLPFCQDTLPVSTIFHSSLPRARHTAQLLFGRRMALEEGRRFRELERKVMKSPNVKLPLKAYMTTSRLLWLMGLNDKGIESYREARYRVRLNAEFLSQQAEAEGLAVLVAHGFHNRLVVRYLRKEGWLHLHNGGKGYWSSQVLGKATSKS